MANTLDSIIDYLADAVVKDANGDATVNDLKLELDTTAAAGTTDGDLYAAITALGWESEVIDALSNVIAKKAFTKLMSQVKQTSDKIHTQNIANISYTSTTTWAKAGSVTIPKAGLYRVRAAYQNAGVQGFAYGDVNATAMAQTQLVGEVGTGMSIDGVVYLNAGGYSFWTKCSSAGKTNYIGVWTLVDF